MFERMPTVVPAAPRPKPLLCLAHGLHRAGAAIAGPVPAERQPVLDSGVAPDQLLARRAAVGVGFGLIDEVLLPEAPVRLRA